MATIQELLLKLIQKYCLVATGAAAFVGLRGRAFLIGVSHILLFDRFLLAAL